MRFLSLRLADGRISPFGIVVWSVVGLAMWAAIILPIMHVART